MTGEERQAWADKMRELDKSSAKEEQPTEEAPFKKDFAKAQV